MSSFFHVQRDACNSSATSHMEATINGHPSFQPPVFFSKWMYNKLFIIYVWEKSEINYVNE